jgi:2-acylglycerol O-acyltransferase 2
METVTGVLNAEPADDESRKQQELPPKSFAEALQEESPTNSNQHADEKVNGANQSNGHSGAEVATGDDGASAEKPVVLRIVNTHGEAESESAKDGSEKIDEKNEGEESRPNMARQGSKSEYSTAVCTTLLP